jgi:hypothetical protein
LRSSLTADAETAAEQSAHASLLSVDHDPRASECQ